ncbi:MAG: hypothetical protein M1840_007369 [Geoglossum simile]|nr:MAG: hypothetical protein M1840_007369 [Geoglossum simile]
MPENLTYPKIPRGTVVRYNHRATYDLRTIHTIFNTTPVVHVSFTPDPDEPFPAILPMIGQMGSFEYPSADIDEPLECYLHGYVSSRIINLAREATKREGSRGIPVCIAATKIDGLVLSLTPNSHSYNYRSAILHGYASLVTSDEEKLWAMELITNSVVPGRWINSRIPPDKTEQDSTQILRILIESGSGKVRDGMPNDDKKDLDRAEVLDRVWTGVVPMWEQFGEPIPGPYNKVAEVPEYITGFVSAANEGHRRQAVAAAKTPAPKRVKKTDEE